MNIEAPTGGISAGFVTSLLERHAEQGRWQFLVFAAAIVIVVIVAFVLLYRSSPPAVRAALKTEAISATDALLGGLKNVDLVPGTNIDNVLFEQLYRLFKERSAADVEVLRDQLVKRGLLPDEHGAIG